MNLKPRYLKSSLDSIFILKKTYKSSFVPSPLSLSIFNTEQGKRWDNGGDKEGGGEGAEEDRAAKMTESQSQYHQGVPSDIHSLPSSPFDLTKFSSPEAWNLCFYAKHLLVNTFQITSLFSSVSPGGESKVQTLNVCHWVQL